MKAAAISSYKGSTVSFRISKYALPLLDWQSMSRQRILVFVVAVKLAIASLISDERRPHDTDTMRAAAG